jgi:2-aminoadipate transaminase
MTIKKLFSDSIPQAAGSIPYLSEDDSEIFLFHIGIPSEETFPSGLIRETVNREDFPWNTAMQYSPVAGSLTIREGISRLYGYRGEIAVPEEIVVTAGIAEAFDLLPELFINPGDVIYTEDPSYPWGIRSFKVHRAEVKAIETGSGGLNLEILEEEIKKDGRRAKLIYTMPIFHNPLGIVTPEKNRENLLRLAEKYNLVIIEDDPYRELSFDGNAPLSLRRLSSERVINLGTFSKTIGGGVRLGWILAHPSIVDKLVQIKHTGTTTFTAEAVGRLLHSPAFYDHLRKVRRYYREKKELCRSALTENGLENLIKYESRGGFYYWLELPGAVDEKSFFEKAFAEGLYLLDGRFFSENPALKRFFRLSFSYENGEKLAAGIKKMAKIMNRLG